MSTRQGETVLQAVHILSLKITKFHVSVRAHKSPQKNRTNILQGARQKLWLVS